MMPHAIQPALFPRGVADAEGRYACVRDREGRFVAIDLEHGRVLWRSAERLRPLVIAHGEVIALAPGPPPVCVALPLEGSEARREKWHSDPLPLPEWADPDSADPARFAITAVAEGTRITLHWRARVRYEGGAAPSKRVLKESARDAAGSVAVDRSSGKVTELSTELSGEPVAETGPAALAPDVLEQRTVGARRYELALQSGAQSARTTLRARDARSGALLWETIIDEGLRRPPKPLRP